MTKRVVYNPCVVSADIDLPNEEKRKLPPVEFLGTVYEFGTKGEVRIDIRDHLGREWTIGAMSRRALRSKFHYFRTVPKETVKAAIPGVPVSWNHWPKAKGLECSSCKSSVRMKPDNNSVLACPTCGVMGDSSYPQFVLKAVKPKSVDPSPADSKVDSPKKPDKAPKQETVTDPPKPIKRASLMDRMKANKPK